MATAKMYGQAFKTAFNKEWDWDTDTIKVLLTTSTYTPDQDAHDYKNDVTNEVANGGGYTTGGITLANKTTTYTGGTNKHKLDADDVTWTSSSITARYAVIYMDTGTASTSPLLGYVDFVTDQTSSSANFTLTWDANGIFEVTIA